MIKIDVYSASTGKKTSMSLPKEYEVKPNKKLLAQAIHVYRSRSHIGISKVQTRGEVSLTKAKWYKQKGTGRARHGAQSAPIFVGGGQAHGPKGVKRVLTLPKKMKKAALLTSITLKAKDGKLSVVNGLAKVTKTKDAQKLVDVISNKKITLVVGEKSEKTARAFRNIKNVKLVNFNNLNAYKVYLANNLVMDKSVLTKKEETK